MNNDISTPSFTKFNYLLRPSKQVERKLFIEALLRLSAGGYSLNDYTYLGFGSVYYADFVLFHKYLYIDQMICAEVEDIPKRMKFNQPYEFINLKMQEVADVVPGLDREKSYIVWLDYDYPLNDETLRDITSLLEILKPGSIFIISVEADHQFPGVKDIRDFAPEDKIDEMLRRFRKQLGKYHDGEIKKSMITHHGLPSLLARVLQRVLRENLPSESGSRFFQLFNFKYADGAQMLSLGGIIGDRSTQRRLNRSRIYDLEFVTGAPEPIRISVPPLTPREKQWLDQHLNKDLTVDKLKFELEQEMLDSFRKFYKYYPTYYETLL